MSLKFVDPNNSSLNISNVHLLQRNSDAIASGQYCP